MPLRTRLAGRGLQSEPGRPGRREDSIRGQLRRTLDSLERAERFVQGLCPPIRRGHAAGYWVRERGSEGGRQRFEYVVSPCRRFAPVCHLQPHSHIDRGAFLWFEKCVAKLSAPKRAGSLSRALDACSRAVSG